MCFWVVVHSRIVPQPQQRLLFFFFLQTISQSGKVGRLPWNWAIQWVMGTAEQIAKLLCYNLIAYAFPNGAKSRGHLWTSKPTTSHKTVSPRSSIRRYRCFKTCNTKPRQRHVLSSSMRKQTRHHLMNYCCCQHDLMRIHMYVCEMHGNPHL